MNRPDASILNTETADTRSEQSTGLSGYWLVLARGICVVVFGFSLLVFFADLPGYAGQLHLVCRSSVCSLWQFTPKSVLELQQIGLTVNSYAIFSLILSIISIFVWSVVGAIIAWRKSNDWMALLVSILMVSFGVAGQGALDFNQLTTILAPSSSPWFGPTIVVCFLAVFLFLLVFLLFPDGRFVPGWMRWFLVAGIALAGGGAILFIFHVPFSQWRYPLIFGGIMGTDAPVMFAQLYRYRSVSTPTQRQQTRWIVLGVIVGMLMLVGAYLPPLLYSSLNHDSLYFLMIKPVSTLIFFFPPMCFGIAILRYRLWDIDIIINRTLVYGTLTVLLALVYLGLVISLESLMRLFTRQVLQSPIIIVASTLVIAALFNPLRRRIQVFIDRRFYRSKYDAARALAAFSATLSHEVDLDDLSWQLVTVVQEAMQPTHVSLWLRPPEHDGKHRAPWRTNPSNKWDETKMSLDRDKYNNPVH